MRRHSERSEESDWTFLVQVHTGSDSVQIPCLARDDKLQSANITQPTKNVDGTAISPRTARGSDYTYRMTDVDALLKSWDLALWEYSLVFEGLSDDDLWKRPAPGLLSIGELTAHVGFYEAVSVRGPAPASEEEYVNYPYKTIFFAAAARYYPVNLPEPITLPYTVAEVEAELKRVHEDAVAYVRSLDIDLTKTMPGRDDWDWFEQLRYRSFHLAYHAGQAYSVRHLLGHETTDN